MNKIYLFLFCFLFVIACTIQVEVDPDDLKKDPIEVSVELTDDLLTVDKIDVDVFFFNSYNGNNFTGIKNGKEVNIPLKFNSTFNIDVNNYGYESNIERVYQLNEKFDLIKGSVTKFLRSHEIVRNDTIFKIKSFQKSFGDKYLLFNKKTYEFVELEKGFDIYNLYNLPRQLIGSKLFYLNSISGRADIKFIDLEDSYLTPQTYFSTDYITSFLFNSNMDLFYSSGAVSNNKFVSFNTGNVMKVTGLDFGLISHFQGLDGKFYAQSFLGSLERPRLGFYSIDVEDDKLTATNLFTFNQDLYPDHDRYLGNADIVFSNTKRNSSTIISTNSGSGTMYSYEFNYADNSITPFDLPIISLLDIYSYNGEFFMLTELAGNGFTNLKKIDFLDYKITFNKSLGYLGKEVYFDKNNGAIYFLELINDVTKFSKLDFDNEISSFEFSVDFGGHFSVID